MPERGCSGNRRRLHHLLLLLFLLLLFLLLLLDLHFNGRRNLFLLHGRTEVVRQLDVNLEMTRAEPRGLHHGLRAGSVETLGQLGGDLGADAARVNIEFSLKRGILDLLRQLRLGGVEMKLKSLLTGRSCDSEKVFHVGVWYLYTIVKFYAILFIYLLV